MMKLLWFGAPLVLAIGVLAGGGASVFAAGPPSSPPGQGPCSHGNSDKTCRPDPSTNGKDCDPHGNNGVGGVNEDHCLGTPVTTTDVPVTTTPVTTTTASTGSTTPSTTTNSSTTTMVSPTTSTGSSSATTSATTGSSTETSPIVTAQTTSAGNGTSGASTPPLLAKKKAASGVAGAEASRKARATAKARATRKPKRSSAIAAAKPKVPSVLPFTP